jgi:cytochrome oxidase Cu insertion factor (SCO1/SenC/PrrC family)
MHAATLPRRRARLTVLALFALFLAPVVAAWLLHATAPHWHPQRTVNQGTLITPARPLPAAPLAAVGGSHVDENVLRGHWTLLLFGETPCDRDCQALLLQLRQVHAALNKDIPRVQRLLVLVGPQATAPPPIDPDLLLARLRDRSWLAHFALDTGSQPAASGRVYLVDPLGNLMMFYPAGGPVRGILKDLQRLLRISRVG